ncbi:MAG: hypothetical protein WC671_01585 [Candidatus Paceibacterota bacterium]|jgi:hypothetical protein
MEKKDFVYRKDGVHYSIDKSKDYGEEHAKLIKEYDKNVADLESWVIEAGKINTKIEKNEHLEKRVQDVKIIAEKIEKLIKEIRIIEKKNKL